MKLIFDQSLVKIVFEVPIVFGDISSHWCLLGRRDILVVMSDFDPIYMKFGIEVGDDV